MRPALRTLTRRFAPTSPFRARQDSLMVRYAAQGFWRRCFYACNRRKREGRGGGKKHNTDDSSKAVV